MSGLLGAEHQCGEAVALLYCLKPGEQGEQVSQLHLVAHPKVRSLFRRKFFQLCANLLGAVLEALYKILRISNQILLINNEIH